MKNGKWLAGEHMNISTSMDSMNQAGETITRAKLQKPCVTHLKMGRSPCCSTRLPRKWMSSSVSSSNAEPFYEKAKHIIDVNVMDNFDKINNTVQQIKETC